MSFRHAIQTLFLLTAVAGASLAPRSAQAQEINKGQIVSAVAKLNQAQMKLAKALADDPTFAEQFDAATQSGNYDAAAALVASAAGLGKSNVTVSQRRSLSSVNNNGAAQQRNMFYLASLRSEPAAAIKSATICFNFGIVGGCIVW